MTQRKINGLLISITVVVLYILKIFLQIMYKPFYQSMGVLMPIYEVNIIINLVIIIIIFSVSLVWSFRYGLFTIGIRKSLITWQITKNLRKQFIDARFTDDERLNVSDE